jgi:hypothetical protein
MVKALLDPGLLPSRVYFRGPATNKVTLPGKGHTHLKSVL